jgi:DNA-directed RNA polymerase
MVNVLPNDSPSDIYGIAGDYVAKQIEQIEDIEIRNSLSRIKIHRNLMKKAVMTASRQYNISLSGLSDDLQRNFFKPNFTQDNGKIKVNFILNDPKYIKDPNNNSLIFIGKEFGLLASIIH